MKKNSCKCGACRMNGCLCGPYARFFDALGNTNRIHIVNSLRAGTKSVGEIVDETQLEQSCVSHCLRKLQTSGFVSGKRDGKRRIYTINDTIEPLMRLIDSHVRKHCT